MLSACGAQLEVRILKRRGPPAARPLLIDVRAGEEAMAEAGNPQGAGMAGVGSGTR